VVRLEHHKRGRQMAFATVSLQVGEKVVGAGERGVCGAACGLTGEKSPVFVEPGLFVCCS